MNPKSKLWIAIVAVAAVVGVVFAPAIAQKPEGGVTPPPAGDEVTRMMTMMQQMQDQMKQMREQMKGMDGMGVMHGRMMGAMEKMTGMMEQHRAEMQRPCAGQPRQGG